MELATIQTELQADRDLVDSYLRQLLGVEAAKANGPVQEAMRYAVFGAAQRVRPILALRVARMLDASLELTMLPAAAIELLHCASLIVDDLPCMDDSPVRRHRPAAHIKFGESIAILAAFGLVALAARILVEHDYDDTERDILVQFQIRLLRSMDCAGLIAGQALDLQLTHQRHLRTRRSVTEMKTVPLFKLAVSAGALFAQADPNQQALLDCFGREFGVAFQMADDLLDGEQVDTSALYEKLAMLRTVIEIFGSPRRELDELIDYLNARIVDSDAG